ncbi:MAG: cysteine synthase family protein [Myxococcota bacterium]
MRAGPDQVIDLIGNTPLFRLRQVTRDLPDDVEVYAKAEWFNPGGSVKDRAAKGIVLDAFERGLLAKGGTLLDSSSGNTGIAYAMLGAVIGFRVVLCLPQNANHERQRTLIAYGTELVLTDPAESSDGAIRKAKEMIAAHPDRYFYADQYANDANWRAHYETTGPELVEQTEARLTHFVTGLGTTGTCTGTGRYLREKLPNAKVVAFQPDAPFHGLEGLKHLETSIVPPIYDAAVPHEQRSCVTERGYELARAVSGTEGLFIGVSSGAAISIAMEVAREEAEAGRPAVIVALCPDGGDRYLSERFWEEGRGT